MRRESSRQPKWLSVGGFGQHIAATFNVVFVITVLTVAITVPAPGAAGVGQGQTGVNAGDASGLKALERAVDQGDLSSVRALVQAGADVNAKDSTGRTPLSWAALRGQLEIVRALARASADLNVKDQQGWTPVKLAFEARQFSVVLALIDAGAAVDRDQMRKDVNKIDASGETLLARTRDAPSIRALVQLGADPNATSSGRTVLAWAASAGDLDRVRALIEAGANVNLKDPQGWTALVLAADMGYTNVVEALLKAGADANQEGPPGSTALMRAAYFGRLETVRVLIPAADVNHRNKNDITALTLARWACHPGIVEALTRAGATAGAGEWRRAPRFDEFPVDRIYKSAPAPVDLRSNAEARTYRTRLREGARKGPNFAGHYTVVGWGCGSNCEATMVVDAVTGRVYAGIGDERGSVFKLNSNLLIADPGDPPPVPAQAGDPTARLPVRYYVWTNHALKLIFEEACSVVDGNQKCGCESLEEPSPNQ